MLKFQDQDPGYRNGELLLGLVVVRDAEIEHFVSKPFYQVIANLLTKDGDRFKARWQPSEECLPWQDEEGRVLSQGLAENVAARITHQPATVTSSSRKKRLHQKKTDHR